MKKRVITGAILSVVAGTLIYFGGVYFAVVALVCICFALSEEYKAIRGAGYHPVAEPTWVALGISIPLMEKRQLKNKPGYAEYRKQTRMLI